ncbi:MAG: hypothetical protein Q4Q58_01340 [Thermoplasmata archaeon]|nr:hypothetical protein [Thermoplasmata archaeon]
MKAAGRGKGSPRALEVWNADTPFDSGGSKDRPVAVLGRRGGTYDVMMSTTHPNDRGTYMKPMDPFSAGLDSRSHIRTDRLYRLPESAFNYPIGELGDDDAAVLQAKYERMRGSRWTGPPWRRTSCPRPPTGSAST